MPVTSEERYATAEISHGERPVRLGTFLFTLVDPHAGNEVAYNRWYERDHFYSGCMAGPHTLAGNRYVATRACKDVRFGSKSDLAAGSYLALYWIEDGYHDAWNSWAVERVHALHAAGRMFAARDHVETGFYKYEAEITAPGSSMPIELALDRSYAGISVFMVETDRSASCADVVAKLGEMNYPGEITVIGSPVPFDDRSPADIAATGMETLAIVSFSPDNPLATWDDASRPLGNAIEEAGIGRIRLASPFLATEFGTDRYADELF